MTRVTLFGRHLGRHRDWHRARNAVPALAGVAALSLFLTPAVPSNAAASTLRAAAEGSGRYFGTALTDGDLGVSGETNIAGTQFDMVTPGNEMKWDTTEPSNGSYNFGPGDQIVSFAQSHSMRVRGHNLVWHSQLPSWVSNLPSNQVQAAMESHITTEATHYRGKVYSWDVVNEPFNDDGTLRQDAFYNAMGTGYIADAIRTAHAADPNAKLYLNDYNIEGENTKSNAMYTLAQSLLSQGVPLNGIGLESHFILGQVPTSMLANMQRFANLGLDVAITELDDRIQLPASTSNLQQQATDYNTVVSDCMAVTHCVGISQWGIDDGHSWIPGTFPGYGAATMYDNNYQPKPAYNAALTALGSGNNGNRVTVTSPGDQSGAVGTAVSLTVHASDSASGQTLTYAAGGLPPGLSLNAGTGVISGTPTTAGSYPVTVTATDGTGVSGTASFTWTIGSTGGGGTCHVVYTTSNQWAGGFVANVTITDTGTAPIANWTTAFSFPGDQKITNGWNATVSQNGAAVTASAMSYNSTIAPGGTVSFGFQGTWNASDSAPTSFQVNGATCD